MKKFEFTGETKIILNEFDTTVLHRIKALVRIESNAGNVKVGDIGGWIENESNLSHDGNAWVYGNARVYGNAEIYGDARIWGDAEVYEDAMVCGDSEVYGNARIYDNAEVCGNARLSGNADAFRTEHYLVMGPIGSRNAFTTFFRTKDGRITVVCGCFSGTIDEFLAKVKQTHGNSKHAKVYQAAVEVALAQFGDVENENIKEKSVTKYKIQQNDSLSSICEHFNITLDEFMDANPELIIESGYLNIPEPKSKA